MCVDAWGYVVWYHDAAADGASSGKTVEILASDRFHSTYDVVMNVYTTEGSTTELLVVAPDGAKIASYVDSGTAADDDPYAWSKLSHEARVTAFASRKENPFEPIVSSTSG